MARWSWLGWGLAALAAGSACQEGDTVTAPALEVTCAARPSTGPVPLAVSFLVSVSGAQGPFSVSISYGDGSSGTSPDAPHVYTTAGSFTASFTVTTATQSARCAAAVTPVGASPTPVPGDNQPPVAVFKTTPDAVGSRITGPAPLGVRFNLCASTDPEKDALFFEMDFDGDGRFDKGGTTGAQCRSDHVYAAGTWRPLVCVTDVDATGRPLHDRQCARYTVTATP